MMPSTGPRRESRAYKGLVKLHANGGSLSAHTWTRTLMWSDSFSTFLTAVVAPLEAAGLIGHYHDVFKITPKGLAHLGIAFGTPMPEPLTVAGGRYVPSQRTLSSKNMTRMPLTREGALDYRDIPSRVGDQFIAHGKKA